MTARVPKANRRYAEPWSPTVDEPIMAERHQANVEENMAKRDPNAEWDDIPGFNGQSGE